eukprot:667817-Rhodomonas_salina.2
MTLYWSESSSPSAGSFGTRGTGAGRCDARLVRLKDDLVGSTPGAKGTRGSRWRGLKLWT